MNDWSEIEVELTVSSYFNMLEKEMIGQKYSKAEYRRSLLPLLNNRSEGSIEFKHQNISAVLIRSGQPYIKGYLPRYNYQKALEMAVENHLKSNPVFGNYFQRFIEQLVDLPDLEHFNFDNILVDPPKNNFVEEPRSEYDRKSTKVNYLEREQSNTQLGQMGEEFVLEYERFRLQKLGRTSLAKKIVWISKEEGDGAGYDILSKNVDGSDKHIEVKTTKLGKETPFYFSINELNFSKDFKDSYHLFRLFDFKEKPRIFVKNGALNEICYHTPVNFKGHF